DEPRLYRHAVRAAFIHLRLARQVPEGLLWRGRRRPHAHPRPAGGVRRRLPWNRADGHPPAAADTRAVARATSRAHFRHIGELLPPGTSGPYTMPDRPPLDCKLAVPHRKETTWRRNRTASRRRTKAMRGPWASAAAAIACATTRSRARAQPAPCPS